MAIKSLSDLLAEGVEGRGVLVRSDLNVPLDDSGNITDPGRIMGTFIIVVGVGIFGTLTGYLANLFLSPTRRRIEKQDSLLSRYEQLQRVSAQQQQAINELGEMIKRS